jgi:hypothetical protein
MTRLRVNRDREFVMLGVVALLGLLVLVEIAARF